MSVLLYSSVFVSSLAEGTHSSLLWFVVVAALGGFGRDGTRRRHLAGRRPVSAASHRQSERPAANETAKTGFRLF